MQNYLLGLRADVQDTFTKTQEENTLVFQMAPHITGGNLPKHVTVQH